MQRRAPHALPVDSNGEAPQPGITEPCGVVHDDDLAQRVCHDRHHGVPDRIERQTGPKTTRNIRNCRINLRNASCIPSWYRFGMSTQIAVRLSDDMVAFIDDLVRRGDAGSRAAVVSRALERERRRKVAERDAAILSRHEPDPDLDGLAEFAATIPLEDLD
jgi:Arc/MetJ-type ribon-helix-helix transcriptional regulator